MFANTTHAPLTSFVTQLAPEIVLAVFACVLFLGSTFRPGRRLWGYVALIGLVLAKVALTSVVNNGALLDHGVSDVTAYVFAAPVLFTKLSVFFKFLALVFGMLLVLLGWNDPDDEHAGEYHGCLLLIVAGTSLTGSANDLITLFLALELVSIPTYVLLYLARTQEPAQEAAMKYFMLSIFSSALLLFGFSYLYGVAGTTNIPAIIETLSAGRQPLAEMTAEQRAMAGWPGLALIALVMVVAGLGFKITAVPFHFYAPDVYQGTTTPAAALLAFVPKVIGFAALLKLLGLIHPLAGLGGVVRDGGQPQLAMGEQMPVLLWIMAAVTMSLGNVLALLQDNVRRMLAYSSVAHAGYMLIGLAVAPQLWSDSTASQAGAVESILFYLVAYGAMTIGAFAVLFYLETPDRRIEKIDDLAGLGKTHPGAALLMLLFMLSLIGIPLTAGFYGKFLLFYNALGLSGAERSELQEGTLKALVDQVRLFRILVVIGAINAAIGGWYYLKVITAMYLREAVEPLPKAKPSPALVCGLCCAAITLVLGIYPPPILEGLKSAIPQRPAKVVAER